MSNTQQPRIMKSMLTKPPRWFVVTRYEVKQGVSISGKNAGETTAYLVAKEKFDVTDQMNAILKDARKATKP